MITSKKITVAGLALIALMTSNMVFSAEYMMCMKQSTVQFGQPMISIKNGTVECEGETSGKSYEVKLTKLVTEGWKVEHMNTFSLHYLDSGSGNRATTYFLMRKD